MSFVSLKASPIACGRVMPGVRRLAFTEMEASLFGGKTMLRKFCFSIFLIVVVVGYVSAQPTSSNKVAAKTTTVAFVNVNVVPMDGERIVQNQTVIVRNGRIAAMGAAKRVRVPKGAVKIDGRGRYLLPGLVDMHVHLEHFDHDAELLPFLATGVTTLRSMDGRENILLWRKRAADGSLLASTIFTAGEVLEGKPPARNDTRVFETPAQGEAAVEEQKRAGYDFIFAKTTRRTRGFVC
jgi:hypothetical protein